VVVGNIITQAAVFSYNGAVRSNFVVDDQLVKQPELLAKFWQQEVDELKRELL